MYNKAKLVQKKHNLYKKVQLVQQSTTCNTKHNLYNKAQFVQQSTICTTKHTCTTKYNLYNKAQLVRQSKICTNNFQLSMRWILKQHLTGDYIIKPTVTRGKQRGARKKIGQHPVNVTSSVNPTIKNIINRS